MPKQKANLLGLWFATLVAVCANTATAAPKAATTVLIITDQPKAAKAQEVANLFRTTEPFSLMKDLTFKVIQTTTAKLGCQTAPVTVSQTSDLNVSADEALAQSEWRDRAARIHQPLSFDQKSKATALPASCDQKSAPIARLVTCETPQTLTYVGALAKTERAKYAVIVKNDSRYGGSGGTYPVITSGSPAAMAEHELLHQLGFADEYSYPNACEADLYCANTKGDSISPAGFGTLPGDSFNIAKFNSRGSYASNADVRKIHGKDIPWLTLIAANVDLLTAGRLGTQTTISGVGLFRSIVCDKASIRTDTWQSTTETSVMKSLSTTHIPKDFWPTIAKSLGAQITSP